MLYVIERKREREKKKRGWKIDARDEAIEEFLWHINWDMLVSNNPGGLSSWYAFIATLKSALTNTFHTLPQPLQPIIEKLCHEK